MIIEKRWLVKFKDVELGLVFEYYGKIYMRVHKIDIMDTDGKDETVCNAVDLSNGEIHVFGDDEEVAIYDNAKVTLI